MKPDERIPQHEHTNRNDGGKLSSSSVSGFLDLTTVGGGGNGSGGGTTVVGTGSGTPGWFNVKTYGAVGDGTTDDRVACQAAATAATAHGGVLYFPYGSYKISTPGLVVGANVTILGDGREATYILAGTNSINVVSITGTANDSTYEVNHASPISGIEFGANGKTGCDGVAFINVAYFDVRRCTFRGFAIGSEYYGALQGRFDDCKFLSNTRGSKLSTQTSYAALPPSRVIFSWCSFYYNTTWAIDYSGGQQIILDSCEFGDNGTAGNAATGMVKIRMAGDAGGFGLVGRNLWIEASHGFAAFDLGGTVVGEHSLIDCWFAYTDATYSIALDGSTAAQTLTAYNVRHDTVVSPATVSTFRSVGGTTHLDARWSNGSTSGTWTSVRQEPLLSGQLVADYSQWLALRLPNVTTTQRDAIASPTAGMLVWNTTTTAVNQYTGSAWAAIGGGTVTSVAMTVPAEFSVSGSPVTGAGTLAITKATETANTVWAGPTSGSAAQPAFRALVVADYPFHDEPLTDGASNFIFDGGDTITVIGVPN